MSQKCLRQRSKCVNSVTLQSHATAFIAHAYTNARNGRRINVYVTGNVVSF